MYGAIYLKHTNEYLGNSKSYRQQSELILSYFLNNTLIKGCLQIDISTIINV